MTHLNNDPTYNNKYSHAARNGSSVNTKCKSCSILVKQKQKYNILYVFMFFKI